MAGLGELRFDGRRALQGLRIADWMRDAEGTLAPGLLAVLADSVLGWVLMADQPLERGMATSHLHLELLRSIPREMTHLESVGEKRASDERIGLSEGAITDGAGTLLAKATIGGVFLKIVRRHRRHADGASAPVAEPIQRDVVERSPVLGELGAQVLSADASGTRMRLRADRRFANSAGGVHGGFGVLMGERTLDLALRTALAGEREMRPVELRAAFLRPVVADAAEVESRAVVMHLGRRLAAVRGELCDHEGRPAVLVDATYVAV